MGELDVIKHVPLVIRSPSLHSIGLPTNKGIGVRTLVICLVPAVLLEIYATSGLQWLPQLNLALGEC